MSRGRVLIVVQNLPVPFDRRVWLEATTLQRAGYDVSVISPKAKGFDRSHELIEDVEVFRYKLPVDAQGSIGFVLEFVWCFVMTSLLTLRVHRRRGFDVLHVCNPPETYFPLAWLWKLAGRRFLFDHHDLSPEMYDAKFGDDASSLVRRGLLWFERRTFRTADLVITTNESHKRIAVERGDKDPDDVIVVRSGPDLTRLELTGPDQELRTHPTLAVYLGEICEQDGVDHLVRASKIVHEELGRTDIGFVYVGGGPHQPTIKAYADELGCGPYSEFTGRVSDERLCEVLSTADIGVDPDPKNPWSDQSTMNKIMEYMYFGLPIVSYRLTEAMVSAGDAALFVEANDERALAEGIVALADDPTRRGEMGTIGRARIENSLSWEHSEPPLLAAYDRLLP